MSSRRQFGFPARGAAGLFTSLLALLSFVAQVPAQTVSQQPTAVDLKYAPSAYLQTTSITDLASDENPDGFKLFRFRPGFSVQLSKTMSAKTLIDFAGDKTVLMDAFVEAKTAEHVTLSVGKMKAPFALERLQSPKATLFLQRAFTSYIAPNRDTGVQALGRFMDKLLEIHIGVFNGTADGSSGESNDDESYDLISRLWLNPKIDKDITLGLGGAISYGERKGASGLTKFKAPAGRTLFTYSSGPLADGDLFRWHTSFYSVIRNISLQGEYTSSTTNMLIGTTHTSITASAWQMAGSFVLNGTPGFKGITPRDQNSHNTIELKARIHGFTLDSDAFTSGAATAEQAESALAIGAGVNWLPVDHVRVLLDIDHVMPTAYSGTIEDETTLMLSFQYAF